MKQVNIEILRAFITMARENRGYEFVDESEVIKLPGGVRQIGPYREGSLSYTDTYEGNAGFKGIVEVRDDIELIWKIKYKGSIIDEEYKKKSQEIYDALKKALRLFPRDKPWVRSDYPLMVGDLRYFNECEGDITSFSNHERIIHMPTDREVYVYGDKGGLE